jgi:hypothetical protein
VAGLFSGAVCVPNYFNLQKEDAVAVLTFDRDAVITAGMGHQRPSARGDSIIVAPQMVERTVHTHTGWRKLDGEWAYLHGGGALGRLTVQKNCTASKGFSQPDYVACRCLSLTLGHDKFDGR